MNPIDLDRVNATVRNGVVVDLDEYRERAAANKSAARSVFAPAIQAAGGGAMLFLLVLILFFWMYRR